MIGSYEPYRVKMTTWPGVTDGAEAELRRQITTAKTNGEPSFEDVIVERHVKDGTAYIAVTTEATGPFDATDFLRNIVEDVLAKHAPDVFQDGAEAEETWCARLSVNHEYALGAANSHSEADA